MKVYKTLLFTFLFSQAIVAQNNVEQKQITTKHVEAKELNGIKSSDGTNFYIKVEAKKLDGIKSSDGTTFYITTDDKEIIAMQNQKVKWRANIISSCGKQNVGKSEILEVKDGQEKLVITYGKHTFAEIDIKTGKVNCLDSD